MQHNLVPGIFDLKLWRGVLYWTLPLSSYLFNMYIIAFSSTSLPLLIYLMAIMLHPAISIPMAVLFEWFSKHCCFCLGYCQIERKKGMKAKINTSCSKSKKATMIIYFAFILIHQLYLYHNWISFRGATIDAYSADQNSSVIDVEKYFHPKHDFGARVYEQCDCISGNTLACVDADDIQVNIEDKLASMIPPNPDSMQFIFLGNIALLLTFHLIEALWIWDLEYGKYIPMKDFILW